MEILVLNEKNLTKFADNYYQVDLGEVKKDSQADAVLLIKNENIVSQRTTCQCTVANIIKTKEGSEITVQYNTSKIRKIKQRVVLTTEVMSEIYIDIVGEVIE